MMTLRKTFVAFAILVVSGCAGPEQATVPFDPQEVEQEAMAWLDSFLQGIRGGAATYEDALAQFEDHPDFVFLFEGTMFRSKAAVDEGFRGVFEQLQSEAIDVQESFVRALGADMAYVSVTGTFSRTFMDGTVSEERGYGFSIVLVRTAEGWRARFMHNSEVDLVE
jgi:hypothetical protein